jgi:hypothetical protein
MKARRLPCVPAPRIATAALRVAEAAVEAAVDNILVSMVVSFIGTVSVLGMRPAEAKKWKGNWQE